MDRLFKELEYLKLHQDKAQNNFGMVGMGYVVDVLNRYEKEIKGLELINEMKPSHNFLKDKIKELEIELKESMSVRLNHIGTISSLEAQLEMATATLAQAHKKAEFFAGHFNALDAKLKAAIELVRKGFKFSGHFDDCEQEHDDEPCTCGADEFEHQAHIFLSENDEIKAK